MSEKKTTSPATETHGDDDELIHVPEGQSRLRYLLTIGLVLFLLIIFVVADNFQNAMTGSGADPGDQVYLTWTDPLSGEVVERTRTEVNRTGVGLETVMNLGLFSPPSFTLADPMNRSSRPNVEQEDIASFMVLERIAEGSGIDVSDEELKERLAMMGATTEALTNLGRYNRMTGRDVAEMARRALRVQKARAAIEAPFAVSDSAAAVAAWQEQVPEYRFQVVTAAAAAFLDEARAEVPDDEELTRWFREDLPMNEQRALYTEDRVVPEVAYLDLDDESFDSAALFDAYPNNEDVDQGALAQSYYDFNRRLRFMPEEGEDGDEAQDDEAQDDEAVDREAPQEPLPFEEVEERALREAQLNSALGAFLTDMLDRAANGEEVDFEAEAAALGLTVPEVIEEGLTREEVEETDGWGSRQISGQLMFTGVGSFIGRVVVSDEALTIARVAEKSPAAEPPLEDIREEVVELWAEARAAEMAVDTLDAARESLAERPEGLGEEDQWTPTIDAAALEAYAVENGLGWYVRPYLGRGTVPELEEGEEVSPEDKFVQMNFSLFELEPGQVPAPAAGRDGENAFLVRFDSKREKPAEEITARQHLGYRDRVRQEQTEAFLRGYLPGDSPWMLERAQIRWPVREQLEAESESEEDDGDAG